MAAAHTIYKRMADGGEGDDTRTREQSILEHLPLVHYIASRIHERLPRQVDLHDLVQAGVVGLIEAFGNFDASKSVQFHTYASFRIRGAILDTLRSLDWASRSLRDKGREIAKARSKVESALGRRASVEELATEIGISPAKLNEVMTDLHGLHLVNQQVAAPEGEDDTIDLIESAASTWDNPFEAYSKAESLAPLIAAVASLSEREQLIISLYYQEELTMREVAQVAGIAVSRVCQIHAAALIKLKASLAQADTQPQARPR